MVSSNTPDNVVLVKLHYIDSEMDFSIEIYQEDDTASRVLDNKSTSMDA